MSNETGDVWAVFNGEIYNFVTLRRELEAAGHRFRSHTDSEVVIHAYEEWGTDCFRRFDGMFALAISDENNRRLVLARDIMGEKPLFYSHTPERLRFASTLRPLLSSPPPIDDRSLRLYLELGYVPAPFSLARGVSKLPPASFAVFQAKRPPEVSRYWKLESIAASTVNVTYDAAVERLHELLRASVANRLVADVPLGAFLSGGIDSSLVVALMAEASKDRVETFTIGFDDPAADESEHALGVARHLGVSNERLVVSGADVIGELDAMTAAFDEPLADASVLPTLAVAKLARQHVTVSLTGDGADELFGGYRYYVGTDAFDRVARVIPSRLRRVMARGSSHIGNPRIARAIRRVTAEDGAEFFARSGFHRGGTADTSAAYVLGSTSRTIDAIADDVRALRGPIGHAAMTWDALHTLPDAWLAKVDRATMAVSLESRAPFLQRDVVELAFQLPFSYRIRRGVKKAPLRSILARYLPRALYERPKQGFAPPMKRWFARELRDELHDRLVPERLTHFPAIDTDGVMRMLASHERGESDHTQMLWALFCLDRWRERYATLLSS